MGREDGEEKDIVQVDSNQDLIAKAQANGFSKREFVAMMGSQTIGFANLENAGSQNRWTQNPHTFDNSYYKEVLLGDRSKFLKT